MTTKLKFKTKKATVEQINKHEGVLTCCKYSEEGYNDEGYSHLLLYYADNVHIGTWNITAKSGWAYEQS